MIYVFIPWWIPNYKGGILCRDFPRLKSPPDSPTIYSRLMKMKQLSELEQEIMNIIWILETCTVREVLNQLNKEKRLAYTTVMTIMGRMVDKGVLVRNLHGARYIYQPKVSKNNFVASSVHNIFAATVSSLGQEAVTYFVREIQKMSPEKRRNLLKILDELK